MEQCSTKLTILILLKSILHKIYSNLTDTIFYLKSYYSSYIDYMANLQ